MAGSSKHARACAASLEMHMCGSLPEQSKRPVFPSGIGWGESLTIASWFKQKEQDVVLADFGR